MEIFPGDSIKISDHKIPQRDRESCRAIKSGYYRLMSVNTVGSITLRSVVENTLLCISLDLFNKLYINNVVVVTRREK